MLTVLFRKIRSTKWMVMCLFIGFLLAAGMMSSVPIYMDASLQRMLIKDMESYQLQSGKFPGMYNIQTGLKSDVSYEEQLDMINELTELAEKEASAVGIPVGSKKIILRDNLLYLIKGSNEDKNSYTRVKIAAMSDLPEHINIVRGRMYGENGIGSDGVFEVIASELALKTMNINIDNEYTVIPMDSSSESIAVRVVGVYEQSDGNDVYWSETMEPYLNALITDYDCFINSMMPLETVKLTEIYANYSLQYQKIDMNAISGITEAIKADFNDIPEAGYEFEMGVFSILESYIERAASLTRILWVLQIPTMIMLAFYLFMVSKLNVEQEKNEIAVYKSRGASSAQVFGIYAMQSGLLGLLTMFFAPFIGLTLCKLLGVSNGFLEFVNRSGIAAKVTGTAVLYALLAVAVFLVTSLVPIIPASRLSIVQYKQSKTKVVKAALWEKCFIDVVLIAAAGAFLIFYTNDIDVKIASDTFKATGEIDPLLFVFSSCLVMGLGLLFIRLYPYFLRLIYTIGKPFWSPSQYIAITGVCRSQGGKERFLMLFLVVTFSFGLLYANTARAINNNKEDRIYYSNGADIKLMEYWLETVSSEEAGTEIVYTETDFTKYENLEGVEIATKVLTNSSARVQSGKTRLDEVYLMAIEPDKFAQTAWFRNDLLPVHWWNYCNALVDYKSGVLISKSMAEKLELSLGDEIQLKWSGNDSLGVTVLAVIDYWPGINPNQTVKDGSVRDFAVMNYNYAKQNTELAPYEIWLKMKPDATSQALYDDIKAKRLPIQSLADSAQILITEKNEPQLQGMNGAMTLGFIIIMLMTVIGFFIYWILSIKSRTLQFGILRAMGVRFREIIGIIAYEQILVSMASIAAAFVIGGVSSDLFVPQFQNMYAVIDQIPPFRVAAYSADYIKLYVIILIMLAGGFAVLGRIIKGININKALKLGED